MRISRWSFPLSFAAATDAVGTSEFFCRLGQGRRPLFHTGAFCFRAGGGFANSFSLSGLDAMILDSRGFGLNLSQSARHSFFHARDSRFRSTRSHLLSAGIVLSKDAGQPHFQGKHAENAESTRRKRKCTARKRECTISKHECSIRALARAIRLLPTCAGDGAGFLLSAFTCATDTFDVIMMPARFSAACDVRGVSCSNSAA